MNDNFWTGLKIVAAVAATFLIYDFLDPDYSDKINSLTHIDTSIEKLENILSASIEDRGARKEAEFEFKEFSDMVVEGEISPDKFEDIASSILNMRMNKNSEADERNQAIIRELKRAQVTSSFIIESPEELEGILDSIAIRINNLTTFQEDYYRHFLHSDELADLKISAEGPENVEPNIVEIVIDFEPVVVVPKMPLPAKLRRKTEIMIVGKTFGDAPPIQITEKLNLLIDYSKLNKKDSLIIVHFQKKMNKLNPINSIIYDYLEGNQEEEAIDSSEDLNQP